MCSAEEKFEKFFLRYRRDIYAYMARRVSASEVEDLVSETFIVAWRRWEQVEAQSNPLPWLYKVSGNVLRNAIRSTRRRLNLVEKVRRQPDQNMENIEGGDLYIALEKLSFLDREVLILIAWEGLTHREVAEVLDCTVNAVGIKVYRAKKRLEKYLSKELKERWM